MTDYESVRSDWWALLNWHLKINGTRPTGNPEVSGDAWEEDAFAAACNIGNSKEPRDAARTVQYWLDKSQATVSPNIELIAKALFGSNPAYSAWRKDLRAAHQRAEKGKGALKALLSGQVPPRDNEAKVVAQGPEVQSVLEDPGAEGDQLRKTDLFADSIIAKVQRDDFQEREEDIEFLYRFLGDDELCETPTQQFQWALVTGPGGQGKTRLAIHFLERAKARGFRAGFLAKRDLNLRNWRPQQPTLVVIDYVSESPSLVARVLREFASTAMMAGFRFPVRVLLLERDAFTESIKVIVPMDSSGANVRSFWYADTKDHLHHELTTLSSKALLSIMRGRLPSRELSDDVLLGALTRVDPLRRPIFAAGIAQAVADSAADGTDPTSLIGVIQPVDVFSMLIGRARLHFWRDTQALDHATERQRLAKHENLLAIATICLDLTRQDFEDKCPQHSQKYLPNLDSFDQDRYQRMAGGDPKSTLKRLEPDILGEFFVLDRLRSVSTNERQALIDAGLCMGGSHAAIFLVRCARDFAEEWRALGFLKPSNLGPAMDVYVDAAFGIIINLPGDRSKELVETLADTIDSADEPLDAISQASLVKVLMARAFGFLSMSRFQEAVSVCDDVEARIGAKDDLEQRKMLAATLAFKARALESSCQVDDLIKLYTRITARFSGETDESLRDHAISALWNKADLLEKLGRYKEAIAAHEDLIERFKEPDDDFSHERLAQSLYQKLILLGFLREEPKSISSFCDYIIANFGDESGPYFAFLLIAARAAKQVADKAD
jgi:tetratricopeptide (TPR) repeat protein